MGFLCLKESLVFAAVKKEYELWSKLIDHQYTAITIMLGFDLLY